jgi:hypothetical protein
MGVDQDQQRQPKGLVSFRFVLAFWDSGDISHKKYLMLCLPFFLLAGEQTNRRTRETG